MRDGSDESNVSMDRRGEIARRREGRKEGGRVRARGKAGRKERKQNALLRAVLLVSEAFLESSEGL